MLFVEVHNLEKRCLLQGHNYTGQIPTNNQIRPKRSLQYTAFIKNKIKCDDTISSHTVPSKIQLLADVLTKLDKISSSSIVEPLVVGVYEVLTAWFKPCYCIFEQTRQRCGCDNKGQSPEGLWLLLATDVQLLKVLLAEYRLALKMSQWAGFV